MSLVHSLTIGHIDPIAVVERREVVVKRPLDMESVRAFVDGLDGGLEDARFFENYIVVPWLKWNAVNTNAERLAQKLVRDFGCLMADVGNAQMVELTDLSISN